MMLRFRGRFRDDAGIALITVMLVGAVLAGLGILVVTTTITDMRSANSDRTSLRTLDVAEAGVADAISYIRTKGVKQICSTCTTPYNVNNKMLLTYPRGTAKVWIEAVAPYQPPQTRVGRYSITSIGTTTGSAAVGVGQTTGKRTVQEIVDVRPLSFPLGVYTASQINLGGTINIEQESIFSGSCVDSRYKLQYGPGPNGSTLDPYYNIPAGVHSTSYITDKNTTCNPGGPSAADSQAIHQPANGGVCNTTYKADQDALGGPFPGTSCATADAGYGDYDTNGSSFNQSTFVNTYGFLPRGLSDDDYANLKAKAIANGTYFPAGTAVVWPTASTDPSSPNYNPVVYIQNQDGKIQNNDLAGYAWQSDPSCTQNHPTIVIIVDHGNLNLSGNLAGFLFVPDGAIQFTGGPHVVGTMFSKSLTWSGGSDISLNDCFATNTNGGILNVQKYSWREVDS